MGISTAVTYPLKPSTAKINPKRSHQHYNIHASKTPEPLIYHAVNAFARLVKIDG